MDGECQRIWLPVDSDSYRREEIEIPGSEQTSFVLDMFNVVNCDNLIEFTGVWHLIKPQTYEFRC